MCAPTSATAVRTWVPAGTLPESFKKLPDDGNWKETIGHPITTD